MTAHHLLLKQHGQLCKYNYIKHVCLFRFSFLQFESTIAKLSDITVATVSYLNAMCGCSLPPTPVSNNEFTCTDNDAQNVIYRAKLQGIEAHDCINLTNYLQLWIDDERSISIQGNRLQMESSCDLEIESLDVQGACRIGEPSTTSTTPTRNTNTPTNTPTGDPNTSTEDTNTTNDDALSIEVIIGAGAAGGIILVLILLLLIVICYICCRRSKHK